MFRNWLIIKFGILIRKLLGKDVAHRLHQISIVRRFYYFIIRHSFDADSTILWTVSGMKMHIPASNMEFFVFQEYEQETAQEFLTVLQEGDVVVDVGAHVGFYTLLGASRIGERGHVYAFEPAPGNFEILNRNISINNLKNITTIKKAVTDKSSVAQLYLYDSVGNSLFTSSTVPDSKTIRVETTSLDCFFQQNEAAVPRIRVIKIDVEGAEIAVLEGMRAIIEKAQSLSVICEVNLGALRRAGKETKELLALLQELNFRIRLAGSQREISLASLEKRAEKEVLNIICTL